MLVKASIIECGHVGQGLPLARSGFTLLLDGLVISFQFAGRGIKSD